MDYLYALALYTAIYLPILIIFFIFEKFYLSKPVNFPNEEQLQEKISQFTDEIRSPDTSAYEKRYGKAVPNALLKYTSSAPIKDLYYGFWVSENAEEKDEGWFIDIIYPINDKHINSNKWPGTEHLYELGAYGNGDVYLIDPNNENSNVYLFQHEIKNIMDTKMTLDSFLSLNNFYFANEEKDTYISDLPRFSRYKTTIVALWFIFVAFPMVAYTISKLFK